MISFHRSNPISFAVFMLCVAPLPGCRLASSASSPGPGDEGDHPVGAAAARVSESGVFQLRNVQAGTCLNVQGQSNLLAANAYQMPCNVNTGANLWRWLGTGEWRQLQNVQGGLCLNVVGGSSALNTNTHQTTCNDGNGANLWEWVGTGDARLLSNQAAATCLNVEGGWSASGTNTHQWVCSSDNDADNWVVEDVPGIGSSQYNTGASCLAIHVAYPAAASGTFWIDSSDGPVQASCDMDTVGGVGSTLAPPSCAGVKIVQPGAADDEYMIQTVGGPASLYCAGMAGTPKEYLTLQNTGAGVNYARYPASSLSPGTDVTTSYTRVRIDPSTLLVDISDQTYATSTGSLLHSGGPEVTSMPYAIAMACGGGGQANIDLGGTPFSVASQDFTQAGYDASGTATYGSGGQVVDLTGGGSCGWTNPGPYLYNPFDASGGPQLNLQAPEGAIVPLYTWPTTPSWASLATAAAAHPTVAVRAVVNPDSGPSTDTSTIAAYGTGIPTLTAAGVTVLGYVATTGGAKPEATAKAEIDRYKSWYTGIGGIFFDEMSTDVGGEGYYADLTAYAKAAGYTITVGNPGVDVPSAYVGAVDTILIYENTGLPTISFLGGWHAGYDKRNFGIIPHDVSSLDLGFVASARQHVGFIYITDAGINDAGPPNPWNSLSSYFDALLGALE